MSASLHQRFLECCLALFKLHENQEKDVKNCDQILLNKLGTYRVSQKLSPLNFGRYYLYLFKPLALFVNCYLLVKD